MHELDRLANEAAVQPGRISKYRVNHFIYLSGADAVIQLFIEASFKARAFFLTNVFILNFNFCIKNKRLIGGAVSYNGK